MRHFRTYNLAVEFYHLSRGLKLPAHLSNQLDRAASSIALNLAEGRGRRTSKEQKRFFTIAYGSQQECKTILELARMEGSKHWQELDSLGAHLYRLIQNAY